MAGAGPGQTTQSGRRPLSNNRCNQNLRTMSDSPTKARAPLTAEGKSNQLIQSLSFGTGALLWLAWYFGWPVAGNVLPVIGNPIENVMAPILPGNIQLMFDNPMIAASLI